MVGVAYTPIAGSDGGLGTLTSKLAAGVQPGATGNTFPNTGRTILYHINASTSNDKTLIFDTGSCNFGSDHDKTVTTVHSTGTVIERYGPFKKNEFGETVHFSCGGTGGVSDVTIVVVEDPLVG